MARGDKYVNFIMEEREGIIDFLEKISVQMSERVKENSETEYIMLYKNITHSDLATFGKSTSVDTLSKNLLYYLNESEMKDVEKSTNKVFQTAHQSCIGLKTKFYELAELPNPRNGQFSLNEKYQVYLVNDTVEYFKSAYTEKIFQLTDKNISDRAKKNWKFDNLDMKLEEGPFTNLSLHCGVHGLGLSMDEDFHKLRHHIFKGDSFIMLVEKNEIEPKIFIILDKNPIFFSLIGESNKAYEEYQQRLRNKYINQAKLNTSSGNRLREKAIEEEQTRALQSTWRSTLSKEMMGYTQNDGEVFCPFTYITINYDSIGTLFRASHIKGFSDINTKENEKYDINNGLLISANADALFDKHLISVNGNKEIVFSFLMDDMKLRSQLLLASPIFQPVLNDKRMKYLEYHYEVFKEKEKARKKA